MDISGMKQRTAQLREELLDLARTVDDVLNGPDANAWREQLRTICSSIRQLEKRNVPVPDDLRRIKTDLTSSLTVVDEAQAIKDLLRTTLLDVLGDLNIPMRATPRVRSGGRTRINLVHLMEAGLIRDGTRLVHHAKRSGKVYHVYIRSPGIVEATIDGSKQKFDTPSGAASAITRGSADGWEYWAVIEDNGDEVPLKNYREQFRKESKA